MYIENGSALSIDNNSQGFIQDDLVLSPTSILSIFVVNSSTIPTLTVGGCCYLSGTLNVTNKNLTTQNRYLLMDCNKTVGTFSKINVMSSECQSFDVSHDGVGVLLGFYDCGGGEPSGGLIDLKLMYIIVGVVVFIVLVIGGVCFLWKRNKVARDLEKIRNGNQYHPT